MLDDPPTIWCDVRIGPRPEQALVDDHPASSDRRIKVPHRGWQRHTRTVVAGPHHLGATDEGRVGEARQQQDDHSGQDQGWGVLPTLAFCLRHVCCSHSPHIGLEPNRCEVRVVRRHQGAFGVPRILGAVVVGGLGIGWRGGERGTVLSPATAKLGVERVEVHGPDLRHLIRPSVGLIFSRMFQPFSMVVFGDHFGERAAIHRSSKSAGVGSSPRLIAPSRPGRSSPRAPDRPPSGPPTVADAVGSSTATRVSMQVSVSAPAYTWVCELPAAHLSRRSRAERRPYPHSPAPVSFPVSFRQRRRPGALSFDRTAGQTRWALRGSNPRPPPCKGGALAS